MSNLILRILTAFQSKKSMIFTKMLKMMLKNRKTIGFVEKKK